jgi:hypothetical protein
LSGTACVISGAFAAEADGAGGGIGVELFSGRAVGGAGEASPVAEGVVSTGTLVVGVAVGKAVPGSGDAEEVSPGAGGWSGCGCRERALKIQMSEAMHSTNAPAANKILLRTRFAIRK